MLDIALHILGAAIMMAVCLLPSTPWPVAWPWSVCVGGFWFVREWAQRGAVDGWGTQKIAEAAAPAAVALLLALGVTIWRLTRGKRS